MKHPLVSVIIPTYKRYNSLKRAINSVLRQTYPNFELIIVDDNEPDSRFRKMNEFLMGKLTNNERIKYIKHKKSFNGAVARNTGISHSKGRYIAFLDDDDEFLKNKLKFQVRLLEKLDNSWGATYCGSAIYRKNKLIQKNLNLKFGNLKQNLLLIEPSIMGGSTLLVRKSVLKELNGFDPTFNRHQDWEFLIRFFRRYKIAYVNKIFVNIYRDDSRNIPNSKNAAAFRIKYLEKYRKDIGKMPIKLRKEVYKRHYLSIVSILLKNKDIIKALQYFKKTKNFTKISFFEYCKLIINFINSIFPIKLFIFAFFEIFPFSHSLKSIMNTLINSKN